MSPSAEERLTALETEGGHTKELLKEIKDTLRRLPHRISKNTKQQLVDCRAIQDAKKSATVSKIGAPEDYGWLRKILVVLFAIGTVLGGAVYQVAQVDKAASIQIQGGNK